MSTPGAPEAQNYQSQHDQIFNQQVQALRRQTPNVTPDQPKPISINQVVGNSFEGWEEVTVGQDPVKEVLVFPHQNNRTYRAGYVQLMAFGNDYSLKDVRGDIDSVTEFKQENTKARERFKTFNGDASKFLANARANNRRQRKIPGTHMVFSAILPMPLGIGETTAIDWNSSSSGFNKSIVGSAHEAGSNWIQYLKTHGLQGTAMSGGLEQLSQWTNLTTEDIKNAANKVTGGMAGSAAGVLGEMADGMVLGTNVLSGYLLGDNSMHKAAMNSVAGGLVTAPSKKMMQLQGSMMDYAREAAALNGRRQIIMDPGYWQSFQGVNPREFTLQWTVIPENHEDAMNGLALCARLKEFSLPEAVSSVELLAPHYWQIQFSNPLVQSTLLYGNLVIRNIDINFMDNGEVHLSGTPKKFDIKITFAEAKAPNADVYKVFDESLYLKGGKVRNSPSKALSSVGGVISGKGPGGKLSDVFGGSFGGLGSLGGLGDIKTGALGKIADVAGGAIGGISSAIGNAANGVFGEYTGNLVGDTISNSINSAGSVLTNAIATGDFSNLGDKMKDAALVGAAGTVIDAASEVIGEYASKVTDYAMETLGGTIDGVTDWLGTITGSVTVEEQKANEEARDKAKEAKAQQEKVKELKEKLKDVEASTTLSAEQKKQARDKVEQEYKKAQELANQAKASADKAKKVQEAQKAKQVKADEVKKQQEANNKANDSLKGILG